MCGRQVGLWLDEHQLVLATCWEHVGHRWECYDPIHRLRWQPCSGVDVTGVRYLIDLADLPTDVLEQMTADVPLAG